MFWYDNMIPCAKSQTPILQKCCSLYLASQRSGTRYLQEFFESLNSPSIASTRFLTKLAVFSSPTCPTMLIANAWNFLLAFATVLWSCVIRSDSRCTSSKNPIKSCSAGHSEGLVTQGFELELRSSAHCVFRVRSLSHITRHNSVSFTAVIVNICWPTSSPKQSGFFSRSCHPSR